MNAKVCNSFTKKLLNGFHRNPKLGFEPTVPEISGFNHIYVNESSLHCFVITIFGGQANLN